jgi:hypothetical protein
MEIGTGIAIVGIWFGVGLVAFGMKANYEYIAGVAFFAMIATIFIAAK